MIDWGVVGIFFIMMLPLIAGGLTFVLSGMSVEESRKDKGREDNA